MSYNPTRMAGKSNKRARRFNPKAGVKHSDIVKKNGVGFGASPSNKTETRHGFTSVLCEFNKFTQRYACLYAGNNTGLGLTKTGDRTVRVEVGTLYVTTVNKVKEVDDDGKSTLRDKAEIEKYTAGHTVKLPAGTRYSLAASGTSNVELLITETTGYQDDWEELEESTVSIPESVTLVPSMQNAPTRRPRRESKAYLQAQRNSAGKGQVRANAETRNRAHTENVNSSMVVGVNPRPSGPPPADD